MQNLQAKILAASNLSTQEVRILFQNNTQPHPENPGLSGTVSHFTTVSPQ